MNAESRDVDVEARDGRRLAGTLHQSGTKSRGAVLFTSAMATPRSFYASMADWLARRGFVVLTFDYRGIGGSRTGTPAESDATVEDWARRDIPGALNFLRRRADGTDPYVLGHSLGGQIMGLAGDEVDPAGLVTFSAQSGYWRLQYPGQRWKLFLAAWVLFPALTRLFGYLPWRWLYGGEDIPGPAARQWYRWCRRPDYLLGDPRLEGRGGYRRFSAPILAYSFEDDRWGYHEAVDRMMAAYTGADVTRVHLDPGTVGVESIGHFGFFRPAMEPLWEDLLERMRGLQ